MTDSAQQLTIYRSSAGSGKTFTLVREYLRMVLPNPYLYRHILAVTFTNKATEEMKSRILGKLYEISQADSEGLAGIQEYQQIKAELAGHLPDPDSWVASRAKHVLRSILGDYGHFSVSTIESFFQKILRAFARELDIPLGYEVEMNQSYVLERLIENLASRVGTETSLHHLLTNYLLQQLKEEKGWEVFRELLSLGHEIFKESFVGKVKEYVDDQEDMLGLADQIAQKAWKGRSVIENQMVSWANEALDLMKEHHLTREDFKHVGNSVPGYFLKVSRKEFEITPRTKKAYESYDEWLPSNSDPARRSQVEGVLDAGLWEILRKMVDFYEKHESEYFTHLLLSKTAASFGLLGYLERLLNDYRQEHRLLLISDTSRLLTRVIRETDPPFVYEKAGHYYEHFLLDEFQDTSDLQWENFWPLIEESLGYGRFNLLVGDIKQAIYRWRNGNPQLMFIIEQQLASRVNALKLLANWRSSERIVSFNNELFVRASHLISESIELTQDTEVIQALQQFLLLAYEDVQQQAQKQQPKGFGRIAFTEKSGPSRRPVLEGGLEHLLSWVQECREAGYAFGEIAVLVRENKEGILAARHLMSCTITVHGEEEHIPVSSAESLLLESHPQVRWLLASLNLILNPEDDLHKAAWMDLEEVLTHGQQAVTDFSTWKQREVRFADQIHRLRALPLYEVVEALVSQLPGDPSPNNAYVLGFLDAVWEYSSGQDISVPGFMAWWKEEREKRAVKGAGTEDAVQILTIHKSKGLEFPVVMVPFADWALGLSNRSGIAWVDTKGTVYEHDFPVLPVNISSAMAKSDFATAYEAELILTYLDSLNMLYVAFTRPEFRLYIHGNRKKPSKKKTSNKPGTVGELLAALIQNPVTRPESVSGEGDLWMIGEAEKAPEREEESSTASYERLEQFQAPEHRAEPLVHLRASGWLEHSGQSSDYRQTGVIIHEALAKILRKDDVGYAVRELCLRGLIRQQEREHYEKLLEELVTHEEVVGWFSDAWEVKTEAGILDQNGREKRPDRVLIRGGEAIVIDFKTGLETSAHRKQIQTYKDLLSELGYHSVKGYLYYTSLPAVVEV